MASQTFIDSILNSNIYAGKIKMMLPTIDGSGGVGREINGFLDGDLTLNMGNTWGSILPDAETANQIGQFMGIQNQITWIQSSACTWKSTQPLEFDIDVYLVTLSYDQPSIKEDAKEIMKLMAMYVTDENWATAKIHGGYHVDYFKSNKELANVNSAFTRGAAQDTINRGAGAVAGTLQGILGSISKDIDYLGTIALKINNCICIKNLLLNKASFTLSSAYITAYEPLYIKMSLSFRSMRALLTTDIESLLV